MLASVSSLAEALHLMQQRKFDLALVDLSVPDEDGTNFCSRLRAQSPDLGIIGVSSGNGVDDGLRALRAGADDCVSVPFRFRELVARIGAVLRRTRTAGAPAAAVLRAGDLELDLQQRSFRRGEKQIYLSPREFDLLAVLMSNPDTALTHTKLMDALWGTAARGGRIQLRAYIKALRQKIEDHPATPQYIVTQPWVGYRFCKPLHG
jgi:two-component system KDP operon response regulator KdpE